MTLSEAAEQGIARLRKPQWVATAYLTIDLVGGAMGPWAHLYDPPTQAAIGASTPQDILITLIGNDSDWVAVS